MESQSIVESLGDKAGFLLNHTSKAISKPDLHLLSRTHVDDIWILSNRNNQTLRNFQTLLNHGRLSGSNYCSIFPVDQGVKHSAGSAFSPKALYFNPENIIQHAIEGGCNAEASTLAQWAS